MENAKCKMENGLQRTPILQKEVPKAIATRKEVELQIVLGQVGGIGANLILFTGITQADDFRWRLFPARECWHFGATVPGQKVSVASTHQK